MRISGNAASGEERLRPLWDAIVTRLAESRKAPGDLQLSAWQFFNLSTWRRATGSSQALPIDAQHRVSALDLEVFFQQIIAVAVYPYHAETDTFGIVSEYPGGRAPAAPALNIAPGSTLFSHVARLGCTYRSRMIHLDLRTHNAADDVRRGLGDVLYTPVKKPPTGIVSKIVLVSAPASGLLDGLQESIENLVAEHITPATTPISAEPSAISLTFQARKYRVTSSKTL